MYDLLKVTLIGLVSGLAGTGLGGLIVFFKKSISKKLLGFFLELSAGLMISVVCLKLVPEALSQGSSILASFGILAGAFTIFICENLFINPYMKSGKHKGSLVKTGILVGIGIALHNFPEGIAVGSGFESSFTLGISITAVIILHDIPEGIAVALPMKAGGVSSAKAFLYTLLTGVPMAFGAFVGAALGAISPATVSMCLGFAAGAMLYIVFMDILPESKRQYKGQFSSFGGLLGIICGIIISL